MNSHPRLETIRTVLWTLTGAIILLSLFFFALGGLNPTEGGVFAIVIVVLGIAWLVHFWRTRAVAADTRLQAGDRERRGF